MSFALGANFLALNAPSLFPLKTDKRMFGVPLAVNVAHTGRALPVSIQCAFQQLRENGGLDVKGLFRRAASKAKVDQLKEINEANPGRWLRKLELNPLLGSCYVAVSA